MTTGTDIGTDALRALYASPGPFATVYFALEARPEMEQDNEARWHGLCHALAGQGAHSGDIAALTGAFRANEPAAGTLAAFAADGRVQLATVLPGATGADRALWGPLPHLLPLLTWRQQHPAHVVAVVDRAGADLHLYRAGATEGRHVQVTGPDDEIERNQPGGMAQMRYQHRAEDSWEHNATAVAAALDTALREVDAHVLMLAGDVRARQYLTKHLPVRVRRDVTVHPVSGSRSRDGAWAERARQVEDATLAAGREETGAMVQGFSEARAPRGNSVEGAYATLNALAGGRLRTLLVCDDSVEAGRRRDAWYGSGPADVADRRSGLALHAGPHLRGPLADVAVRGALLTGADVRVLDPGTPSAPARGIGGLTRYTRHAEAS
jgi:hypothetical protein